MDELTSVISKSHDSAVGPYTTRCLNISQLLV